MKKTTILFVAFLTIASYSLMAQVAINTDGSSADASAMLDVKSTSAGLLVPRMTTAERSAISAPIPMSLLIFNTTTECFEAWNQNTSSWVAFGCIGCQLPGSFMANAASSITAISFEANWTASAGSSIYYLDVNTNATFTGTWIHNNSNVGNVTAFTVSGLSSGTTHYYRVRAGNSCGTSANSNIIAVMTNAGGPACGNQIFASANLNAGTMVQSTAGGSQQPSPYGYKYCYNNVAANCDTYGGLYEWNNVMLGAASVTCDPCGSGGVQGMCPAGYHIPTDLEWSRYEYCIENNIAPTGTIPLATFQTVVGWRGTNSEVGPGAKMKATSSNSPAWNGTNTSGFNALPAGYRGCENGSFDRINVNNFFWTASKYDDTKVWMRRLDTDNGQDYRYNYDKNFGFSVRCLQN